MNATVAIRRATTADRAFVRDLGRRVSSTSVSTLRPGDPVLVAEAYERLVDYVITRDHAIFIAHEDDVPLGFVMVVFDLPEEVTLTDQAFIAYTAVEPAHARRGIGRALLDAVEALARERNIPHVSLIVTDENVAARALYERAGFATERRLMTKALE
jgi:ribosomal protein S18 acetylase RimI-like enzyme